MSRRNGWILLALLAWAGPARGALSVTDLRCEGQIDPLNIDVPRPRLSWKLASDERGQRQTAYEIRVSGDDGELWDSGKVESGQTIQIAYGGNALSSGQRCRWNVSVWDKDAKQSVAAGAGEWSMGLMSPADWKGKWITWAPPAPNRMPIFRKSFTVSKKVKRAMVYICGLGQFELHVNGEPVSQDVLDPGWTDYRKTCLYLAFDVTGKIADGENVLGVMLGNGMYDVPAARYHKFAGSFGAPMVIGQLSLEYTDGSSEIISTDGSWKAAGGPITFSSIYGGEDYDARLAPTGWDKAGFDASSWAAAAVTSGPGGELAGASRSAPPIRVQQELKPVKVTVVKPGVEVYDLAQNCAMIPELEVAGPAGATVKLTPGELLSRDGTVTQSQSGKGCYYMYTCDSDKPATWRPRFCYYGARYVQVEGDAKVVGLRGLFISSSAPAAGTFECSNDLFNRTATLIDWAIRSNMVSVLTDCPHREKLGWLEQVHLMGPSLMDNYDLSVLLNKTCGDMEDAQHDDGLVPEIAPEYVKFKGGFLDSPEWGSAAVLVPWNLYRWYGDLDGLRRHYPMMRKYVGFLGSRAVDGILDFGLGDWYDLGPKAPGPAQLTPKALTATAFYYHDLVIVAEAGKVLGRAGESAEFTAAAEKVREAFNAKFYDAGKHRYAQGSQTADAIPLVFGINPPGDAGAILDDLIGDVRAHNDGLTAGDVGFRYVLRALADGGRSEVIYDMNRRSDKPGYGYQLAHGATSLAEAWDASPHHSQDHFMLGHIMEWFYSDLAGIQMQDGAVAFNHIRVRPERVGDVTWAKASYESSRGPIEVSWRREGGGIKLDVAIPPGADAVVYVPAKSAQEVSEGGGAASAAMGVKFLRMEVGDAVFAVESGRYSFLSQ